MDLNASSRRNLESASNSRQRSLIHGIDEVVLQSCRSRVAHATTQHRLFGSRRSFNLLNLLVLRSLVLLAVSRAYAKQYLEASLSWMIRELHGSYTRISRRTGPVARRHALLRALVRPRPRAGGEAG